MFALCLKVISWLQVAPIKISARLFGSNKSENRNRSAYFSCPWHCLHKCSVGGSISFAEGDICFSKAQCRSHTQGSEVQALVCLMHNLFWYTRSTHPQLLPQFTL